MSLPPARRLLTRARQWLAGPARRAFPAGTRRRRLLLRLTQVDRFARTPRTAHFPAQDDPAIVVVVRTDGDRERTNRCAESLRAHTQLTRVGVLFDDASDGSGVSHALDTGAPWVVLLHSSCEVQPGWLDVLLATGESDADVGAVGPLLVRPDGAVESAGGILWNDGTISDYGQGASAGAADYRFVRDVDFVPPGCILVRRRLLAERCGEDASYATARYAAADLGLAARAGGLRVVHQPASTVIAEPSADDEKARLIDRDVLVERWADELTRQHRVGTDPIRARCRPGTCRVFVADHRLPRPDHDAGSVRMDAILDVLVDLGCAVTFVPDNGEFLEPYVGDLQQRGIEVVWGPIDQRDLLRSRAPQLCIFSRPDPSVAWMRSARAAVPDATVLYDTVDLHFVREGRRAALEGEGSAGLVRFYQELELALVRAADVTAVVTEAEREILAQHAPDATIVILPVTHEVHDPGPGFEDRAGIMFVGGYEHPPNLDAARFLATEIGPLLAERLPDLEIHLIGSHPPAELETLGARNVHAVGWVEDLEPWYRRCRVAVAPLRYGAGMKGKVSESLSFGVPVVTTTVGAEGMGLADGIDARIVDDARAFADAVAELYLDPERWAALAAAGRRRVESQWSHDGLRRSLQTLLRRFSVQG